MPSSTGTLKQVRDRLVRANDPLSMAIVNIRQASINACDQARSKVLNSEFPTVVVHCARTQVSSALGPAAAASHAAPRAYVSHGFAHYGVGSSPWDQTPGRHLRRVEITSAPFAFPWPGFLQGCILRFLLAQAPLKFCSKGPLWKMPYESNCFSTNRVRCSFTMRVRG